MSPARAEVAPGLRRAGAGGLPGDLRETPGCGGIRGKTSRGARGAAARGARCTGHAEAGGCGVQCLLGEELAGQEGVGERARAAASEPGGADRRGTDSRTVAQPLPQLQPIQRAPGPPARQAHSAPRCRRALRSDEGGLSPQPGGAAAAFTCPLARVWLSVVFVLVRRPRVSDLCPQP